MVELAGGGSGHFGAGEGEEMPRWEETSEVNLLSAIQAGMFRFPFCPGAARPLAQVIPDHLIIDSV